MDDNAPVKAASSDATLLVVDDDESNLTSIRKIFEREGYRVLTAPEGQRALELCRQHVVDVALSDLMMPGMSGIDLVKALQTVSPDVEVVMMTAYGTIEKAVSAMRAGAYDFVEKPLKRMHIVKTVRKAVERRSLVAENKSLKKELSALRRRRAVGSSPAFRQAMDVATQAAPSSATLLILGESGTGKELLARHVHERSGRAGPFVSLNLAAIPETIVESELFGHERGAFTGASQRREGRITQAAQGTLFLDEIGELAPSVQVKLLRVLQDGEYEPLGGSTQYADFRLIAATNRDLAGAVRDGDFREDLFYRLNVIAVTTPPLRDRLDDVPLLVDHFLDLYCQKNQKPRIDVGREAMQRLTTYAWPGNVRELENVIERAVVLSKNTTLETTDLPDPIAHANEPPPSEMTFSLGTPLSEIETRIIHRTLRHTHGDKRLAAQLLGISTRTIYRKMGAERE